MQNAYTPLSHGISVVDAHYVQPGIASTYIMVQGKQISVIETGTAHTVPHLLKAIAQLGFSVDDVTYVIPTHIHLDHAGGAGLLLQRCPHAKLVIHPRGAAHMINPEKLEAGTIAVYGEERYRQLYGALTPVEKKRVIIANDGFELDFNGRTLTFIDTPGHALHHFCVYDSLSEGIFTGDNFGIAYKELRSSSGEFVFATTTPVHFDPVAMHDSINRLLALNPKVLYLTHFGAIEANAHHVAQLQRSIDAFVEIANQEIDHTEGRVERMAKQISSWLLAQLAKTDCPLPIEEQKALLENDCSLNAQGLDVWLKRLEKNKAATKVP